MQERYEVARVKTETSTEGRKFGELFEEHSNSIWCDSQTKDERKIKGQKRAAKSYLSGYVLDIYLAMPKRSVASAPNISMN